MNRETWNRFLSVFPFAVLGSIACLQLFSLWTIYRAGDFGYFDLGLINDWMTNALRGKPFFVTQTQSSQLTYNFTPSLLLFAPLWILENQFILVILNLVCFYAGIFLLIREAQRTLRVQVPAGQLCLLLCAMTVCTAETKFTRYVLTYPHYEAIFALPAGLLFIFMHREGNLFRALSIPVVIFACGLRQDAGFYMFFFFIAALMIAPDSLTIVRRISVPLLITAIATIVAATGTTPFLSENVAGLRFWRHMGSNPWDVLIYILSHPAEIYREVRASAFLDLNKSFGYLPLLSPAGWFANLAALPMYLARPDEFMAKRLLLLYNSAMILPALVVSVVATIRQALALLARTEDVWPRYVPRMRVAFILLVGFLLIRQVAWEKPWLTTFRGEGDLYSSVAKAIEEVRKSCEIDSIAGDYYGVTLAPNSLLRFVLPNAHGADLILITDRIQYAPDHLDRDQLLESLEGYRIHSQSSRVTLLLKKGTRCK